VSSNEDKFFSNILYLYIYEGRMVRVLSPYSNSYRELAESTMSFNRRLNEERRMRIPYIDGQVGKRVASTCGGPLGYQLLSFVV
jgi:hypothetical protein